MGVALCKPSDQWETEEGAGWCLHHDRRGLSTTSFATSVLEGLGSRPRQLDCRWLYDAEGSSLYERITETEDYYPTRTEDRILAEHAPAIRSAAGGGALVELGSGSSTKTRHLLDAWAAVGPVSYAPIDVSAAALRGACEDLARRYPGAAIEAFAAGYERGLDAVARVTPKTVVFLGSTLGNYDPEGTRGFLAMIRDCLAPGDHFLLGVDRVKPGPVLEAAYDDREGWTRRFILNLFARMNRELGAGVPVDALRYEARWNEVAEQVEMWVHVERDFTMVVDGERIELSRGEPILVEISRKFRRGEVVAVAEELGLASVGQWSDELGWFSVLLFAR